MLQDITNIALAKALDGTALRHRAIANNLANVETPGFQRQDVAFESELRTALDSTSLPLDSQMDEVRAVSPDVVGDAVSPARENGNNVDPDHEMASLAENTIRYEAVLQSMTVKDTMLRNAIWEGKK
jgi:flagellar basal-body rod protein FlgB